MESDPEWEHRLRELRRVVPIAQTQSIGGVIITIFSLDDYAEGFAVRVRILLEEWHPVAEEARAREAAIQRTWEEARQREQETEVEEAQERAFLSGDHESLLYPEFELLAFDEGGRQYDPGFGGGNQWSSLLEGWLDAHFNPALEPSVRRLRLVVPEVRWRRNWGKHRDEGERTDQGPWTFEVVLPERE